MSDLARRAAILGLLSAVGPFAIDMYLPAMPTIAADLGTTVAGAQATLTVFFVSFGLAQLIYGPWADAAGRKPPLMAGLALYLLASIGATFAPDIATLTLARAVQGLGAAAVMVIPRAIIRDWSTGPEAARMMALVMMVISVSPMLAPLAGSLVILWFDWRAIFGVLALAAVISLIVTSRGLPETLAVADRRPVHFAGLLRDAGGLFRHRGFMVLTFIGAFGMASFFVFIASASFVYTGQFGLSPMGFSLAFAINAAGFFLASQLAGPFGERFGMARVVRTATAGFAAATVALAGIALAGQASLVVIVGMLLLANACLGLVIPSVMVMALDDQGEVAGLASSLGGTLQMLTGGAMAAAAAPFFDGTATPMILTIALCGVIALILSRLLPDQAASVAT
ncbi:multidrug effflux MFS transporter [Jannaschia sp. 2305UL9-9]|uniref:multidrug effflux MFS transporter n=1 Tax=Jannaschia sp. 2305UL9-9 TaxID=3121638 RepID=UPI0035287053